MEQLSNDIRQRIEKMLDSERVVLFMKGTRSQPQCGFSATTIHILDSLVPNYTTVNVLEDPSIRDGIKAFSEWPTIPQLYIDRQFIGGCDIVKQLFNSGELHQTLGFEAADRTPPVITLSDAATQMFRDALDTNPAMSVCMSIDSRWQTQFNLGSAEGHEIRAQANGIDILVDLATAQRARGIHIDIAETVDGTAFDVRNPNAPPPVASMSPIELRRQLDAGVDLQLIDVRGPDERIIADIEGSQLLDEERMKTLDKNTSLVFFCRSGRRSQTAAENYRLQGFVNVSNLTGGTNAWSVDVDPSITRY